MVGGEGGAGGTAAGLTSAAVRSGYDASAQAWADVAPFLRALDEPAQAAVRRAAEHAAGSGGGPLVVPMLVLAAW